MKQYISISSLIIYLLLVSTLESRAQKIGFIDQEDLILLMSDSIKAIDAEVAAYEEFLSIPFQTKLDELKKDYERAMKGDWFDRDSYNKMKADLLKRQEALEKEQQEIQEQVITKREELVQKMVLDKIELATEEVRKEEDYEQIHDIKEFGNVYYLDKAYEVTAKVRKKLGL